ncbi:MAG: hypothetical protein KDE35_16670, partial [Geminicoccaceae bacterium]|nr:hypothetical protein [Geminicoccaceae bacterium]
GGPANDREGAASRESMAGRGGLRARSALTPGASDRAAGAVAAGGNRLRCTTQPLVVLPQRRLAGLVVTGHLATTGNRATSRRELYALDLPRAELHKFDGALVERALALVRRHGTELAGHRLVVEASAAALAEAAIVEQITALARDPFTRDVDLVLVLDAAEGPRLPSAPPTLPGNLALAVRCDDLGQIDGEGLIAAGIGQVTVAHGVLDAHAAMPLEDDPLRRRLAMLVEAGLEVTVEGLGRESDVLDALDYPIALATGALFGAPSAVMADGACTFFTARTEPPPRARQPLVQRISPSV